MLVRLHQWLGVTLAAWLVLACISGILLLWKDEYYGWRYPALPEAPAVFAPDAELIERILSQNAVSTLGMPTASLPAYYAYLTDGKAALFHPETAQLVDEWTRLDALPAFLFELHTYLFLGETGHTLVGVLGIAVLINLVMGFALWLRKRKIFRVRFILPKSTSRPQLIRGHAAQGSLLSIALFLLAFSGVAMVFAAPVQAGFNVVFGAADSLRPAPVSLQRESGSVDWRKVIANYSQPLPAAELRFLYVPATPEKPVIARLRNAGELHPNGRSYAVLHPESGRVLETIDATQSGLGPSLFDSLYPIHAGKTGWPGYRLLLTLLSLSLLYIAVSGAGLFLTRPRRSRASAQSDSPPAPTRKGPVQTRSD